MDDLFSYPESLVHGGNGPIKPTRRRASPANSFRAAWEPVASPDFGELLGPPHRLGGGVALSRPAESRVAVLDAPRPAPVIDFGELAHPIADVATAVRRRTRTTAWETALGRAA